MSRRSLIRNAAGLGAVAFFAGCASSFTDDPRSKRLWRIGFLAGQASKSDPGGALRQALTNLGYVEGRDFVIELRYAEGDPERLPELAAELVNTPVDLIVTTAGGNPVRAAKQVTQTIPIVFTGLSDPVGQGLVPNLARPGGNVTGVAGLAELSGKRLELLREAVPSLSRVAVFYHPSEAGQLIQVRTIENAARTLGVELQPVANDTLDELCAGLDDVARGGPDGLIDCHGSSFYGPARAKFGTMLDFAVKHRLPQIFGGAEVVKAGALMSLGASTEGRFRVVANLVDKILKGANPGSLPIQVADTLDLALNLTMARKIGLTFPESLLRQATEVIQ